MKLTASIFTLLVVCTSSAHAQIGIKLNIKVMQLDRDNCASDWRKIEEKRKQFFQAGNWQMVSVAQEEASIAARCYQEADQKIKELELELARINLRK